MYGRNWIVVMFSLNILAHKILEIEGDDLDSRYLRAVHVYPLAISLLFPPPLGGINNLNPSTIVSSAKTTAAAKLFDYRAFNLDSAWNNTEYEQSGLKVARKTLRPKALFADRVAQSLFRNHLFHKRRGISYLLDIPIFELNEEDFETRKYEMETMAELVNIYMICTSEIQERSKTNGIDIVINLYLDHSSEMGDDKVIGEKTLSNNWKRLKSAAIFHYLYKFQDYLHPIFSPPAVHSAAFAELIIAMSERQSLLALLQAYDHVSSKLNEMFGLDIPFTGVPATSVKLRDNSRHRDKFLKHLK
jgi:hypothetical protein